MRSANYLRGIGERRVAPTTDTIGGLKALAGPLPDSGASPDEILALLDNVAAAATIAGHAGRYFGFVVGGTVPGALVASWLNSTWDQCCGLNVMSPAGAQLESVALEWVIEVLGLPSGCGGGVVTGCTMANFSAITAARYALLERVGWDVVSKGLYGGALDQNRLNTFGAGDLVVEVLLFFRSQKGNSG